MHILATLFALLFSFGHASSVRHAMAVQPITSSSAVVFTPQPAFVPVRTAALTHIRIAR